MHSRRRTTIEILPGKRTIKRTGKGTTMPWEFTRRRIMM
jgi:hypothetical protein